MSKFNHQHIKMCRVRASSPNAEVTVLGDSGIERRIKLILVQLSQRDRPPRFGTGRLENDVVNGDPSPESAHDSWSKTVVDISLFAATKMTIV